MRACAGSGPSPTRPDALARWPRGPLRGFYPVCVWPSREEIHSRGQVKEITCREVREAETSDGGRASRRFPSRVCAVGFRRNLTKVLFCCLPATVRDWATPRFPGLLGRIRGLHSALRAAYRFCSSLPSQILKVYTLAWSLALTGSLMHGTLKQHKTS